MSVDSRTGYPLGPRVVYLMVTWFVVHGRQILWHEISREMGSEDFMENFWRNLNILDYHDVK
jgi:hypothetical protein